MAHSNELSQRATNSAPSPRRDGDAAAESTGSPARLPGWMLALGALVLVVAGVLLWLQLFVARELPELTEARFEAAQALWDKNGSQAYNMDITIRGAQPGRVEIEVRDGKPSAMQRDNVSPPERTWDTWTVPGMFQMLVDEFALRDDPTHKGQGAPGAEVWLRCEFDPHYGYPRTYQRLMTGGGPEVFWHVNKFEPK
jgi:Family of unknown function (DUF6174)